MPPSTLHFSPLMFAHAPAVAKLHLHIWKIAYAPIFGEAVQGLPEAEFLHTWQKRLSPGSYQCLGLWQGGKLRGFSGWGELAADRTEIYHFYLHPDCWGGHQAATFMQQVLAQLRAGKYREVVLWVLKENKRAQRFYEKQGFRLTQREQHRERYGLQLHEIEMAQQL